MLLRLAYALVHSWFRLYTLGLERTARQDRADDVAAYYIEWECEQRALRSTPARIGLRLLPTVISGATGDLAWRWDTDLGPRVMPPLRWMWRWRHSGLVLGNYLRLWLSPGVAEFVVGPIRPPLRVALTIAFIGAAWNAVAALVGDVRVARVPYRLQRYPLAPGEDDGGVLEAMMVLVRWRLSLRYQLDR